MLLRRLVLYEDVQRTVLSETACANKTHTCQQCQQCDRKPHHFYSRDTGATEPTLAPLLEVCHLLLFLLQLL